MARFAINIVTYNSVDMIDQCLASVLSQTYRDYRVTVVDNASTDDTLKHLDAWCDRGVKVVSNDQNAYYCRAHNAAIRQSDSEYVLTLNPDVVIRPDYLSRVADAMTLAPTIGSVNGKLLLPPESPKELSACLAHPPENARIDGAGLMMLRSRRPYLRGNRRRNREACLQAEYIFGADGACATYRRAMLEDIAIHGEYFDEDFVMYREDVDLAWRAQLYAWDAYYTPAAVGYHVRGFHLGGSRRAIPAFVKRQSVKNGWLLVIKNDSLRSVLRNSLFISLYQMKVVAGLVVVEQTSLGAIRDVLALMPRVREKRAEIQSKRRRSDAEMTPWFQWRIA